MSLLLAGICHFEYIHLYISITSLETMEVKYIIIKSRSFLKFTMTYYKYDLLKQSIVVYLHESCYCTDVDQVVMVMQCDIWPSFTISAQNTFAEWEQRAFVTVVQQSRLHHKSAFITTYGPCFG